MHIQFQLCGLCILSLLIVFYKSHKNLMLYKEKLFFFVLCMITVSIMGLNWNPRFQFAKVNLFSEYFLQE